MIVARADRLHPSEDTASLELNLDRSGAVHDATITDLALSVIAPAPHRAVVAQPEAMDAARRDLHQAIEIGPAEVFDRLGSSLINTCGVDADLAVGIATPSPHLAVCIKQQAVISACGNLGLCRVARVGPEYRQDEGAKDEL